VKSSLCRATRGFFFAAWASIVATLPASAQVINPSFEDSPNFNGWTTTGSANIVTASFGKTPPDGLNQALIDNDLTNGSVSVGDLETALGLNSGTLTGLGQGTVTDGSAFQQTFTTLKPSVLSFRWDFLTSEDPNFSPNNDFAFITVNGQVTTLAQFADATVVLPFDPANPLPPPSTDEYLTETGYKTFTVALATPGPNTIGFGVVNVQTNDIASALLVDNLSLTAMAPEPGSGKLLTLLLPLLLVMPIARRRARPAAVPKTK
jgi:hypothetical protein